MAHSDSDYDDDDSGDEEDDEDCLRFVSDLLADKAWALDYYSGRKDEFERCEKLYLKEHYSSGVESGPMEVMDEATDDTEHLTVVPIITNIINSVHGVLTDEDFYTQCISTTGRKSLEAATKTERFVHGTYWINRQTNGADPWEDAAMDALVYGWGCVYSYWDPERASVTRSKGKDRKQTLDFYSYPIVVKRLNPSDIYPLPNGTRERWRGVMWVVNRTVREIEEEWDFKFAPTPVMQEDKELAYDDNDEVLYQEYDQDTFVEFIDSWSWKRDDGRGGRDWTLWHCVLAAEQVVKKPTPMYEYEMLPYEIFFCRKSTSDSGSLMGLSFMFPIIEPVQEIERLANRQSRIIDLYADPMLLIEGAAQGQDTDIEKGPGTTISVDMGGDARYITFNGSPPDVERMMRMWKDIAQDAYPPVMTGLQGGTSGLDTIALQQGGKLQTNKPRRNLELAIQRVNTKIIRLLQQFSWDEPVYVIGQRSEGDENVPFDFSIKGKDTRGYETTIVTVRGRFPQEELRNVTLASQVSGAGLMSKREAAGKYLYTQDPERSFKLYLQEQMIEDPLWRQYFFNQYTALPAQSPVSQALEGAGEEELPIDGMDMAGGMAAASMATNPTQVQQGVQSTAVESNAFSKMAGGVPAVGGPPRVGG